MTPGRFVTDLRSLGIGAPLRAVYELSKRTGAHSLLFRGALPRSTPRFSSPFPPPPPLLPSARERVLRAASRIVNGDVEIFGEEVSIGSAPDWHRIIHEQGRWPLLPWWKVDIRSDARPGDVKWVWELARHRHLVLLARAAYLDPSDVRYSRTLETHLRSWLDQNPPERGVHWYSNLEMALRAIAWLQVLSLAHDSLEPATVTGMHQTLYLMGRHLVVDLPYTVSTMRNNHLVGDGLGLVALGLSFPDDRAARRWVRIGDRLLTHQIRRHFRSDGSSIEDSISYNRFVLEMLAVRKLLGKAPAVVEIAQSASAHFLARLGVLEGSVPQLGDWDEGRVLAVAANPESLDGTLHLAFSLLGTGAPAEWSEKNDEVAWFIGNGTPETPPPAVINGEDTGSDIGRARSGEWTVWLKAGSGPSHGHADLLSTPILYRDNWVVGDPGTGTYNGPINQRNYFRSSLAHSVTRVEEVDQLEPHRAFRWKHRAEGRLGEPVVLQNRVLMWGYHNAYDRLDPPRRVARVVVVSPVRVTVADWVGGPGPLALASSLPLAPDSTPNGDELRLSDGTTMALWSSGDVRSVRGATQPFDGWWSDSYGSMVPATRLEVTTDTSPIGWSISLDDPIQPALDDDTMILDQLRIRISFDAAGVHLGVRSGNERLERTLA